MKNLKHIFCGPKHDVIWRIYIIAILVGRVLREPNKRQGFLSIKG